MHIDMKKFGRSLTTRAAGRAAYDVIISTPEWGTEVASFDFDGVESITNSFADEVFGRMASEHGMGWMRKHTTFCNISNFWAMVVRSAMDHRAPKAAVA